MNGKQEFIKTVELLIENTNEFNEEAIKFFEQFIKNEDNSEKPLFTENGKRIMIFMQNSDREMWKAKELADELQISSRSVSGSCRKLVTDGFVEKVGKDPVIYTLSSKGKEIIINEEGDNE